MSEQKSGKTLCGPHTPGFVGFFAMILAVSACSGGSGGSGSNSNDGGLGANAVELPQIDGFGLVTHIEPADLNADGRKDLIMFRTSDLYTGRKIVAIMNTTSGFTVDESYFPSVADQPWVDRVYYVDLNGDGHKDIITHQHMGGEFETIGPLVWNETSSQFEALPDNIFSTQLRGFVPIDADNDGDLDLLTHDWFTTEWSLIRNDNGSFVQGPDPLFTATTETGFIYHPVVMDLNNDGRDDLIFGGPKYDEGWVNATEPVTVMINGVGGWYQADNSTVFNGDAPEFTHLRLTRAADFNNDGETDIAIANTGYDAGGFPGEYNGLLMNTGAGGFTVDTSSAAFDYKGFSHALAVGDLDKDGDVDIVYADITGDDVDYRDPIRILYNDGTGNFTAKVATLSADWATENSGGWTAAALVDLDGDTYLDLVLGGQASGAASFVFYNDGYGYFR